MGPSPPYLVRLQLKEGAPDGGEYPFSLLRQVEGRRKAGRLNGVTRRQPAAG